MATEKPRTISVKLELDVVESARIVSAYRGESMTELVSRILRSILAKMEQEETTKRAKKLNRKEKAGGSES
jgi:hypothetical protein